MVIFAAVGPAEDVRMLGIIVPKPVAGNQESFETFETQE
jgi:hypothetical protein